ncbi:MAG: hypothetical protein AAGJ94_09930, partial [Pseudomonadota bacterium]
ALAIFMVVFLRLRAQASWTRTLAIGGGSIALILVMAGVLNRDFPPGLLQAYVSLPWPFGMD